ncbi:MAG: hypothetical protein HY644_01650 [Acidobacteria bacterium]|nr:hypothetical protein [Acidobacteriota bacterium]
MTTEELQLMANSGRTTGDYRTCRVETWLTTDERGFLRAVATKQRKSMSAVLRHLLNEYARRVLPHE